MLEYARQGRGLSLRNQFQDVFLSTSARQTSSDSADPGIAGRLASRPPLTDGRSSATGAAGDKHRVREAYSRLDKVRVERW
jgi:hypothetical protein